MINEAPCDYTAHTYIHEKLAFVDYLLIRRVKNVCQFLNLFSIVLNLAHQFMLSYAFNEHKHSHLI